ncbi:unnamed protein product [Peronospora belbahrii]|uniref:Anaphase-promoting complex subunit 5 n=1 Tax=Peronospora belbahrii TaxID=622444 RepID=A0ABN8D1M2_9STRA|nr:unnamed protein product [Peronospora belbahrii]
MKRRSLNALARFITLEIQHPLFMTNQRFTTLYNLLQRLEINLNNTTDFNHLSYELVRILTKIQSPDAVWNTIEQITECVAPVQSSREDEEVDVDSASSTLVRTSLLGVFVRSFLLAVNRLLFDGLSRLFDDVEQYVKQFRDDMQRETKQKQEEEEKDSNLALLGSPASQHLWNDSKMETDKLLLSPIKSQSVVPTYNLRLSSLMTPASSKLDIQPYVNKLQAVEAVQEVNDPAVWSNDQLNYILNDMVREMDGVGSNYRRENPWTQEQLCLLCKTMDRSNPNVLFVRYLHFLSDRDYQGALDSLHQYHDVLAPRQGASLSGNVGSDGNSSASRSVGGVGLHFRGSGIQYAALNLAGLQIVFDHYHAAQESIQEAIRVAQHHGDHICVAFALAWMIRINQKIGSSKDDVLQLVGSCLDRAKELRLPALQVLATLTEVESDLKRYSPTRSDAVGSASQSVSHVFASHAPSPRPLHIWSRLYKAMQSIASISTPRASSSNTGTRAMTALQAQAGAGRDSSDRSSGSGMNWVKSVEAILDTVWKLSGKVTLTTAAGWSLYGQRSLEQAFNHMHLLCYEDSASTGEIAQTVSQMAISSLAQTDKQGVVYARALNFLVSLFEGESNIERRHLLNDMTFQRTLHYLFFSWALERGEFTRAEVHLNAILVLSPQEKDFPSYLEALLLKAHLWTLVGDCAQSLKLLESLENTCRELGFAHLHAQVLIAISRTRFQASAPHAPFTILNVLLESVDVCQRHHYDLLLAEAHVVMAEMYIAMGKVRDAYSLIHDQMPLVMEHGSVNLRGECLLVLAKTMVANIKQLNNGTDGSSPAGMKAIHTLSASAKMFALVQNLRRLKEVCYVQSLVYNHMAHQAEQHKNIESNAFYARREEAATMFLKHSSQLQRAAFFTVEPFFDLKIPETMRRIIAHRLSEL